MNDTLHLGEKLNETLDQAGAFGRSAGTKLDEVRRYTADVIAGSASSVRKAGERIDSLAGSTAATLDSTATYVRRHNSRGMFVDVMRVMRHHPATLAAGAAAAGFLLGLAVERSGRQPRTTDYRRAEN